MLIRIVNLSEKSDALWNWFEKNMLFTIIISFVDKLNMFNLQTTSLRSTAFSFYTIKVTVTYSQTYITCSNTWKIMQCYIYNNKHQSTHNSQLSFNKAYFHWCLSFHISSMFVYVVLRLKHVKNLIYLPCLLIKKKTVKHLILWF